MSTADYTIFSFLLWALALAATGAFAGILADRYKISIQIQERK